MSEETIEREVSEESESNSEATEVNAVEEANANPLEAELKKAKEEVEKLRQDILYERADFQNYKRRTAGDFLDIKRESVKKLISSLLEPLDSLDKVVMSNENPSAEMKPFIDGVEMIRKQLNGILEKEKVFKIDPKGEAFDPSTMEAISSEDLEELTEETVIEVYRSGYVFKETDKTISLRTAMVKVGRPKF